MKTENFISALVEDHMVFQPVLGPNFGLRMLGGLALSLCVFFIFLGVRPDFANVMTDSHIVFKFIFAASVFGSLLPLVIHTIRPENDLGRGLLWLGLPSITLVGGVTFQILTDPSDFLLSGMIGRYPMACLKSISVLAAGPLLALMLMMRSGATTQPIIAGALAGAASGGMGAFIYALHCPDDSALFVALWYSLSIGITTLVGAAIGSKLLRW